MTDREKVIKGLTVCLTGGAGCDGCPYDEECYASPDAIKDGLLSDVLELLREQEKEYRRLLKRTGGYKMNGRQAAKEAAKRIEELEHTIVQYKRDVQDYNRVIEDMIAGKSPCTWCEDVGECILDANGSVGCHEWMLRFRKPGEQPEGGDADGQETGTNVNPIFGVEE